MTDFNPNQYGPVFAEWINTKEYSPLDHGNPLSKKSPPTVAEAFAHTDIADHDLAEACVAGVLLLHNRLDDSHTISQNIDTPEGSLWHGIMHRREGDFWNSKYWFRQAGKHPIYKTLGEHSECGELPELVSKGVFKPDVFVDLAEEAVGAGREDDDALIWIQQIEWETAFNYCFSRASQN